MAESSYVAFGLAPNDGVLWQYPLNLNVTSTLMVKITSILRLRCSPPSTHPNAHFVCSLVSLACLWGVGIPKWDCRVYVYQNASWCVCFPFVWLVPISFVLGFPLALSVYVPIPQAPFSFTSHEGSTLEEVWLISSLFWTISVLGLSNSTNAW